jgi:hypothetical protein
MFQLERPFAQISANSLDKGARAHLTTAVLFMVLR